MQRYNLWDMPYPEFFIRIKSKQRKKANSDDAIKYYFRLCLITLTVNVVLFFILSFSFFEGIIADWVVPYSLKNYINLFSKEEYAKISNKIYDYYNLFIYATLIISGYLSIILDRYIKLDISSSYAKKNKVANFLYSIFVYLFVTVFANIFSVFFKYLVVSDFLDGVAYKINTLINILTVYHIGVFIAVYIAVYIFIHILFYYLLREITEFMICMFISILIYYILVNSSLLLSKNTIFYFLIYIATISLFQIIKITPIIGGICSLIAKYCYTPKFMFFTSLKLTFCFMSLGLGARFVDVVHIWQSFKIDLKDEIQIKKCKYSRLNSKH